MRIGRRRFVTTALASVVGSALCGTAAAGLRSSKPAIEVTPLADGLILLTGAGTNALAARGPEGVVLVDGGLEAQSAALVERALRELSARRVAMLFNTHWHPESTGANVRLGRRGTTIVAHENTKLWLGRKISVDWLEGAYGPLPAAALPKQTIFYGSATVPLGDEEIEYGCMAQAHTDGDIYVHFRKANVLAAGGVISGAGWPLLDWQTGGWIGGLVGGIDRLLKVADAGTRIVPAQGPVLSRADLEAQRTMYFTIYERLVSALTRGLSPDEAAAENPAGEFAAQMGDPHDFVIRAFRSMWGHFAPDA